MILYILLYLDICLHYPDSVVNDHVQKIEIKILILSKLSIYWYYLIFILCL